jgi:tetratricopeptide (TPR) repeat protein
MNPISRFQAFSRFLLPVTILFLVTACTSAATTKDWKKYRETARKAAQANEHEFALDQYALAFKEAEATFKGTDLRFLETVSEAANFHVQFRRFDGAVAMYQSALARMPKAKGGEQSYKAAFLTELGTAYVYARKLDQAEESFKAAAQYAEEKLGDQSPLVAEALEGLAAVHIERKNPDEALRILKRALLIATTPGFGRANFNGIQTQYRRGPSTTEYSVQNTIGILHLSQSNYVDAEESFRAALNTVNRQRADTAINFIKSNTATLLRNLALAHRGQQEYREAEDALLRSIVTAEKLEGSALAREQAAALLSEIHFEQNDAELDRLFARLTSKKSSEPDPNNFFAYAEVIIQHYARKDWPRTLPVVNKARNAAPKFSPQLAGLGAKLAVEHKDPENAQVLLADCIAELQKTHGSENANIVSPLKDLADLQLSTGKIEAAEKSYAQLVAAARAAFGSKDSRLANALDDQAAFLEKAGKTKEAEATRAEANQVRTASLLR